VLKWVVLLENELHENFKAFSSVPHLLYIGLSTIVGTEMCEKIYSGRAFI
jgi:hypothetical protein